MNLTAPAADPTGYTFSQWTVNGTAQPAGQKSITFTMPARRRRPWRSTRRTAYTLNVQSTPPTGAEHRFEHGPRRDDELHAVPSVAAGTSVNLQAPATDPTGYTFSQWTVNGTAQTAGQKSISSRCPRHTTAVAQYTLNSYTLTVQSTPPTGVFITSSTGNGGTTNYAVPGVASGTSVNLAAPATDPTGYTFSQWTVNGAAQAAGQKSITFTMSGGHDGRGGVYAGHLHADRAVHAADRRWSSVRARATAARRTTRSPARLRDEREPRRPGDRPDRVHLLAVDGERHGADRRAEDHHLHDDRGHDGGGAVHAEHLRADRAVHAADRAGHRFEHRRRRDDELHDAERRVRHEREPAGPGDGPGRVHLLAVDGERRGADCRAAVH